jgi:hypothetical protein
MGQYALITGSYWAFTLTDGALRMLVVLYFHELGYSPMDIALLFLFYELFGVVTNLLGGWLAARAGLAVTLTGGLFLQVIALSMLLVDTSHLSVGYVMLAQALSGIAKDLNKMGAKSSVKLVAGNSQGRLYRWVAWLTGSKNALKGVGFFAGGAGLASIGFSASVAVMAVAMGVVGILALMLLDKSMGKASFEPKFSDLLSKSRRINLLSAARLFLFGSRDVWFVVALPVFLQLELGWSSVSVGTFLALWIIGYGFIQAMAPSITPRLDGRVPDGRTALLWGLTLALVPLGIAACLQLGFDQTACCGDRTCFLCPSVCDEFGGAFFFGRFLRRCRWRVAGCRILLHGECRRPATGYGMFWVDVSVIRSGCLSWLVCAFYCLGCPRFLQIASAFIANHLSFLRIHGVENSV